MVCNGSGALCGCCRCFRELFPSPLPLPVRLSHAGPRLPAIPCQKPDKRQSGACRETHGPGARADREERGAQVRACPTIIVEPSSSEMT